MKTNVFLLFLTAKRFVYNCKVFVEWNQQSRCTFRTCNDHSGSCVFQPFSSSCIKPWRNIRTVGYLNFISLVYHSYDSCGWRFRKGDWISTKAFKLNMHLFKLFLLMNFIDSFKNFKTIFSNIETDWIMMFPFW